MEAKFDLSLGEQISAGNHKLFLPTLPISSAAKIVIGKQAAQKQDGNQMTDETESTNHKEKLKLIVNAKMNKSKIVSKKVIGAYPI